MCMIWLIDATHRAFVLLSRDHALCTAVGSWEWHGKLLFCAKWGPARRLLPSSGQP